MTALMLQYLTASNTEKLTLREPHDKNHVHNSKFQEIVSGHTVDHNHKRSGQLESSVNIKNLTLNYYMSRSGNYLQKNRK